MKIPLSWIDRDKLMIQFLINYKYVILKAMKLYLVLIVNLKQSR